MQQQKEEKSAHTVHTKCTQMEQKLHNTSIKKKEGVGGSKMDLCDLQVSEQVSFVICDV